MAKILFVIPNLYIGGTNKVLENLLNLIKKKEKYDCKIFALNESGPYENIFSEYMINKHNHIKLVSKFRFYLFKFLNKYARGYMISAEKKRLDNVIKNGNYDIVVAFSEGDTTKIVSKLNISNIIAWIHCDYKKYIDNDSEKVYYSKFNKVVSVSNATRDSFVDVYPDFFEKSVAIHNPIDSAMIKQMAISKQNIDSRFDTDGIFTIVSVGRLDPVKRFHELPRIAKLLKEDGFKFKWYLIGGGYSERSHLISEIGNNKVEDIFIWLGEKNNPYPYIARSDLLVCSSISEACPNVINEAKILHVPVLTTDFPSAHEFIDNGVNGFISSFDKFHSKLNEIISNKDLYNSIKSNISNFEYDNNEILQQISTLFDEVNSK